MMNKTFTLIACLFFISKSYSQGFSDCQLADLTIPINLHAEIVDNGYPSPFGVLLTWESNGNLYLVKIKNMNTGQITSQLVTSPALQLSLPNGNVYKWRVRAYCYQQGSTAWSEMQEFAIPIY